MERLKIVQKYFSSIVIIRLMLSFVFISEGIQKFIFSDTLGVGRFTKIGIPHPGVMAPLVGIVEIVCGGLILLGWFTRLASVPLFISMLVAFSTTKIPLLFEKGFWPMVHEACTDWCMILGLLFLFIVGSGRWSLDDLQTHLFKYHKSP